MIIIIIIIIAALALPIEQFISCIQSVSFTFHPLKQDLLTFMYFVRVRIVTDTSLRSFFSVFHTSRGVQSVHISFEQLFASINMLFQNKFCPTGATERGRVPLCYDVLYVVISAIIQREYFNLC